MVRIRVVLSDVIAEIGTRVGERGRSRSLEGAAQERLERLQLKDALRSTSGILEDKDYPEFKDQDSINGWVRAQRRTAGAS